VWHRRFCFESRHSTCLLLRRLRPRWKANCQRRPPWYACILCVRVASTTKVLNLTMHNNQATGDIFSITVNGAGDDSASKYMLASFHGDTNGLATIPVTTAVHNTKSSHFADHALIFGLDANTYEHSTPGKTQDVRFLIRLAVGAAQGEDNPNRVHRCYSCAPGPRICGSLCRNGPHFMLGRHARSHPAHNV